MELSNREWASLFWIAAFVVYILFKDKNRKIAKSFKNVVHAFFVRKVIVVLAWASFWIIVCVQTLRHVGAWEFSNLKTTLIWAVTFAFVTLFHVDRINEDETYFRRTIRDTFGATGAIIFIAETYNLSFIAELILTPIIFLIALIQIVSKKNSEYEAAHKLANVLLAVMSFALVGYGLYMVVANFGDFATWNTLREFLIPIVLSLLFLPYLYIVSVLMSYELTFVGLRFYLKDDHLRRYAAFQAIKKFRFNLEGLRRWKRHVGSFRPDNHESIRASIAEVRALQEKERNPPLLSPDLGWCPFAATKFLAEQGLATGDYHRMDDGQWWASSPMINLNQAAIFPDNIAYYIEGDERAAKRLKVKLHVNDRTTGAASDLQFRNVCSALLNTVAGGVSPTQREEILQHDTDVTEAAGRRIRLQKDDYANAAKGYCRMLIVDHNLTYCHPY